MFQISEQLVCSCRTQQKGKIRRQAHIVPSADEPLFLLEEERVVEAFGAFSQACQATLLRTRRTTSPEKYEVFIKLVDSSKVMESEPCACAVTNGAPAPFHDVLAHEGVKYKVW